MYNGKIYKLEQNKQIKVDWFMLSKMSWDMQECLKKIVNSPKICNLKITDPSFFADEITYATYYI